MQTPLYHRKAIPFFYDKSDIEFQRDTYERYETVVRQTALHLADNLWGKYPMQPILEFGSMHYPIYATKNILEIGCSVGRWIGEISEKYPEANCWGIDYSYQMLKQANDFWVLGKDIILDLSNKGFQSRTIQGHQLENLQFGLAKAEQLPFADNSQDLIVNSFLLDRLDDPVEALREMYRILIPNGKVIAFTPLNFQKASHWEMFYPSSNIKKILTEIGFKVLLWREDIFIDEPLDIRGNKINWQCLHFVLAKTP